MDEIHKFANALFLIIKCQSFLTFKNTTRFHSRSTYLILLPDNFRLIDHICKLIEVKRIYLGPNGIILDVTGIL